MGCDVTFFWDLFTTRPIGGIQMSKSLIRLLPAVIGLSLGLVGCYDKTEVAGLTEAGSQERGKVAFRLSAEDLIALGTGIDSVRIDAVRDGFAPQSALGGLNQTTTLSGLQAGAWTLKVALFDASQSIHWYGEAIVQVVPGKTVDAEVHLRKATGSVRIRIVLDDETKSVGVDTLEPIFADRKPTWRPIKAWRDAYGVYLVSSLNPPCEKPVISYSGFFAKLVPNDNGLKAAYAQGRSSIMIPVDQSHWVLGSDLDTNLACPAIYRERTFFVPWTVPGDLTLETPTGSIILVDPANLPPLPVVINVPFRDTIRMTATRIADLKNWMDLPIGSVARTDAGLYIETKYDCNIQPFLLADSFYTGSKLLLSLIPMRTRTPTEMYCETKPHILFFPYGPDVDVQVHGLNSAATHFFPGKPKPIVASDSSFRLYTSNIYDEGAGRFTMFQLSPSGWLVRTINGYPITVDTTVVPDSVLLGAGMLANLRSVLESALVRHPASKYVCPLSQASVLDVAGKRVVPPGFDPIIRSRLIDYTDGSLSAQKNEGAIPCVEPASWTSLDLVDSTLQSLFSKI